MNNLSLILSEKAITRFSEILGTEKQAKMYTNAVATILRSNTLLANATQESIYGAVLAAISMGLDISLGEAYIVPYKGQAQFQIGYKGLIKFAIATNQVKKLNACPIYKGQIKTYNALEGNEYDFSVEAEGAPIGYAAVLELHNGYSNSFYMSTEKIKAYGKKYSQSFESKFSPWQTEFDAMACKTVLKKLSPYIPKTTHISYDSAVVIATPDQSFEEANVVMPTYEVGDAEAMQNFEGMDFMAAYKYLKKVKFTEDMTEAMREKLTYYVGDFSDAKELTSVFYDIELNGEFAKIVNDKIKQLNENI
jgi:recombination protein RecT